MKLEIIQFVDQAMKKISQNLAELEKAKEDIVELIESLFGRDDYVLNVISRVKSPASVKEKILRYNLYKEFDSAERLVSEISDLIGIRIECRFIPDEEKVYTKLLEMFDINIGNGYYSCSKNTKIAVKLNEPQPQFQKNGFEIYKIDGHYYENEKTYNFELQIKSLVNNFWGDIEHRILYKNYNYILSERFIKDMMGSIKENLTLIDKQLRVVYDHVFNLQTRNHNEVEQIKDVLKKMTYDAYFHKIRNQLGFVVDFRGIVDLIVDYIFIQEDDCGNSRIGEDFLDILNRLSGTFYREQYFGEIIEYEQNLCFEGVLNKKVGKRILEVINQDFKWNIFFQIIFDIENSDDSSIICKFTNYLVNKFIKMAECVVRSSRFEGEEAEKIKLYLAEAIVDSFILDMSVENLDDITIYALKRNLKGYLFGIVSFEQWERNKASIREGIINYKSPK